MPQPLRKQALTAGAKPTAPEARKAALYGNAARRARRVHDAAERAEVTARNVYGLTNVPGPIEGSPDSRCFLLLGRALLSRTGSDGPSLLIFAPDRSGASHGALPRFARHGLSVMSRVRARPGHSGRLQHASVVDIEGYVREDAMRAAMDEPANMPRGVNALGSYSMEIA